MNDLICKHVKHYLYNSNVNLWTWFDKIINYLLASVLQLLARHLVSLHNKFRVKEAVRRSESNRHMDDVLELASVTGTALEWHSAFSLMTWLLRWTYQCQNVMGKVFPDYRYTMFHFLHIHMFTHAHTFTHKHSYEQYVSCLIQFIHVTHFLRADCWDQFLWQPLIIWWLLTLIFPSLLVFFYSFLSFRWHSAKPWMSYQNSHIPVQNRTPCFHFSHLNL